MWGQVYGQVRRHLSVHTSTKRLCRKGIRRTRKNKEQRTNSKRKAGIFRTVSGVHGTLWVVFSIDGTFWAIFSVGGTFWAVSSVGGTFWAVSRVGGTLLAVLRVGGTFWCLELAVFFGGSGKTKIWRYFSAVMQYGGNILALGCFSFFGGNTLAVGGITKIWW